jgi:hypothetical protein
MLVESKQILNKDGNVGYVEAIFESDNVLKTTYFPESQRLYIAFRRGHTYSYSNIPYDLYLEFETAESQGKFFHENINNNAHSIRKEFTLYPSEVQEAKQIIEENKNEEDE